MFVAFLQSFAIIFPLQYLLEKLQNQNFWTFFSGTIGDARSCFPQCNMCQYYLEYFYYNGNSEIIISSIRSFCYLAVWLLATVCHTLL